MERALLYFTSMAKLCIKSAYTKVRASWPRLLAAVARAPCTPFQYLVVTCASSLLSYRP